MNLIIPSDGQAEQVARDLLSLARSPHDVQTNTDNGLTFVVPNYLAELYAESMQLVQPTEEPAPQPKRGRARKEV